jgi:quinol monooxygenase YgiN
VAFDVCADTIQPNRLIFIEQWHDRYALGRHEDSAHLADFKTNIMPMLQGKQPTEVFFVEHVQEW